MLKQTIQTDLNQALKQGDKAADTLRMLLASIQAKEKDKRYKISKEVPEQELEEKSQLTDSEITDIIFSEIKKRKEAAQAFEAGDRPEMAQKEKGELLVLEKYMPEQLSSEELEKIVQESISKTGAQTMQDIGKVMGQVMPQTKGKADGKEINEMVKKLLGS